MTEAEWLAATDPAPMLDFLRGKVSDRKLRLLCCGCCRSIWQFISDERSRSAVETVEQFVDGHVTENEFRNAEKLALDAEEEANGAEVEATAETGSAAVSYMFQTMNADIVRHVAEFAHSEFGYRVTASELSGITNNKRINEEREWQAFILRDTFGNPFRPITFDPAWLTSDVRVLAAGIYEHRAFDRMPILADALQDAGCDNEDILNHCRQPGEHVRCCWVVDLLLGKK